MKNKQNKMYQRTYRAYEKEQAEIRKNWKKQKHLTFGRWIVAKLLEK